MRASKQLVFSTLMVPASLSLFASRVATGSYLGAILWALAFIGHAWIIVGEVQRHKAGQLPEKD